MVKIKIVKYKINIINNFRYFY